MKLVSVLFLSLFSFTALAQNLTLPDFKYTLNDVLGRGQTKEKLFNNLNRELVKTGSSICSNRAHIWNFDMKRNHGINSAKIFLFYTGKNGEVGSKKWWYHVAPVINEKGQLWVLDGGFPTYVPRPMQIGEWLTKFADTANCKTIQYKEKDLFELMFVGRMYPEVTAYGRNDCYTYIAPGPYWTPASVAQGVLQEDEEGRPIRYARNDYDMDELLQACKEAAAGRLGTVLGGISGKGKKCREYLGIPEED